MNEPLFNEIAKMIDTSSREEALEMLSKEDLCEIIEAQRREIAELQQRVNTAEDESMIYGAMFAREHRKKKAAERSPSETAKNLENVWAYYKDELVHFCRTPERFKGLLKEYCMRIREFGCSVIEPVPNQDKVDLRYHTAIIDGADPSVINDRDAVEGSDIPSVIMPGIRRKDGSVFRKAIIYVDYWEYGEKT